MSQVMFNAQIGTAKHFSHNYLDLYHEWSTFESFGINYRNKYESVDIKVSCQHHTSTLSRYLSFRVKSQTRGGTILQRPLHLADFPIPGWNLDFPDLPKPMSQSVLNIKWEEIFPTIGTGERGSPIHRYRSNFSLGLLYRLLLPLLLLLLLARSTSSSSR